MTFAESVNAVSENSVKSDEFKCTMICSLVSSPAFRSTNLVKKALFFVIVQLTARTSIRETPSLSLGTLGLGCPSEKSLSGFVHELAFFVSMELLRGGERDIVNVGTEERRTELSVFTNCDRKREV